MNHLEWAASSCVLILVVIALRAAFGKRLTPGWRYALWAVVLLRLLVPFEIGGSPWSVAAAVQKSKLPEASETVVAWRNITVSPDLSIPEPDPSLPLAEQRAQYEINRMEWEAQMAEARTVDATPVTVTDVFNWVWYAGMAVTALIFLVSNLRFYLLLRKRRKPLETDCALKVYTVENLSSSCLFGRSIYISVETAEDALKLRHVLAHELSHYRHGDAVWALLRCAALVLHWYDPLAWWAAALSRQDAELFADAGALKALGEDAREDYGATLIELSTCCGRNASLLCTATTMTNGKKALKERITLIAKKPHTPLAVAVVICVVAALAVGSTMVGAQTEPETPDTVAMLARVLEIHDRYFLVENASGRIEVPMRNMEPSPEPQVGDTLEIIYDGIVLETYPARIANVMLIRVAEAAENPIASDSDLTISEIVPYPADFKTDVPSFLRHIQTTDWDWRAAWDKDEKGVMDLLSALGEYTAAHALTDGEFAALLRCTDGLDGAYAEGYDAGVLDALYQKDSARYLRLWAALDGDHQDRAIPFTVHGAVNFAGLDAARQWMLDAAED